MSLTLPPFTGKWTFVKTVARNDTYCLYLWRKYPDGGTYTGKWAIEVIPHKDYYNNRKLLIHDHKDVVLPIWISTLRELGASEEILTKASKLKLKPK